MLVKSNSQAVAVLMATMPSRYALRQQATRCWLGQTTPVALYADQGDDYSAAKYHRLALEAIEAGHEWLFFASDDDWVSPTFLQTRLRAAKDAGASCAGSNVLRFCDLATGRVTRLEVKQRRWVSFGTAIWHKDIWLRHQWEPTAQIGYDTAFVRHAGRAMPAVVDAADFVLCRHHNNDSNQSETGTTDTAPSGFVVADWMIAARSCSTVIEATHPAKNCGRGAL